METKLEYYSVNINFDEILSGQQLTRIQVLEIVF